MATAIATPICDFSDLPQDSCGHCSTPAAPARQVEVRRLALSLMEKHSLIERGWTFGFDSPKARVGQCHFGTKTITLSVHWVEVLPMDTLRNTILHEIAHAMAGVQAGHGPLWKAMARAIGCTGERCAETKGYSIGEKLWTATCPGCARTVGQHRAPLRVKACSTCCKGRFNPRFIFEWKKAGETVTMPQRYRDEIAHMRRKYGAAVSV